jgi:hypothetical protein
MNFAKLFKKSNSSIHQLQGNVLECTIEQIRGAQLIIETGMRPPFVCFRNELSEPSAISEASSALLFATDRKARSENSSYSQNQDAQSDCKQRVSIGSQLLASARLSPTVDRQPLTGILQPRWRTFSKTQSGASPSHVRSMRSSHLGRLADRREALSEELSKIIAIVAPTASRLRKRPLAGAYRPKSLTCLIGIEEKPSNFTGLVEACIAPKSLMRSHKRAQLWAELSKLWRSSAKNRVKGFILNSVNGGFAVAVAGYIAFLPKSLCINKKVFLGQWRQFAIIGMNPKIANIVVKEIRAFATVRSKTKSRGDRRLSRHRR